MLRMALGGALGTGLRLMVLGAALSAAPSASTRLLALNLLGAGLLGWALMRRPLPARWMPALLTGLLGGFTTFSTMVVQAGMLGHDRGLALVAGYLAASVGLGLAAFVIGRRLGSGRASVEVQP